MTIRDLPDEYLRFRDAIIGVMDERFYSPRWLDGQIRMGWAKIWTSANAAIIATMRKYPAGAREVHGLVAVGDLSEIVGLIPLAEEWGRSLGCIVAGIDSRPGWGRALKASGYELYQTALRKEL